jgi:hypothetical protein
MLAYAAATAPGLLRSDPVQIAHKIAVTQ